jgi:hypothetical protein
MITGHGKIADVHDPHCQSIGFADEWIVKERKTDFRFSEILRPITTEQLNVTLDKPC